MKSRFALLCILSLWSFGAMAAEPYLPPAIDSGGSSATSIGRKSRNNGRDTLFAQADEDGDASANSGEFKKPPGPPQGGKIRVPHPDAAKGLIRINKDGSYQYETAIRPKSQAMSVRIMAMSPPSISGTNGATFKSIYGSGSLYSLAVGYEWDPFKSFGALGVQLESGMATGHGHGTLANYNGHASEETYNIFIIPLTAFAVYRFEYVRRQWVVPFINGGMTYYGMIEKRDDDQAPKFAGAPAVGGGGGVHLSISRLDSAGAFALDREYGIADMWLTLEARAMKGLYQDTDFTSGMFSVGVTVDF